MTTSMAKSTRRVYSAEELQRLRGAQSQPKLGEAIEEHDSEDAELVKEHVLRGSRSFAARSLRSRPSAKSLRVPSNKSNNENLSIAAHDLTRPTGLTAPAPTNGRVLGEIASNGQFLRSGPFKMRPSPTPSLKKKAAEDLVKAHGSPQNVRVTAGGRIVPSEQSPLCHPRFGYSAIQANGGLIKFAPNYHGGKPQWTQATEDGCLGHDTNGTIFQIVDGFILPLEAQSDGSFKLYVDCPNLNITQSAQTAQTAPAVAPVVTSVVAPFVPPTSKALVQRNQQRQILRAERSDPPLPSVAVQIRALELQKAKLERDLSELNKTEVIHSRAMSKPAKDTLVANRRKLTLDIDGYRKNIKALLAQNNQPTQSNQPPPNAPTSPRAMRHSISPAGRTRLPPFLQTQHINGNMPMASCGPNQSMPAPAPIMFGQTPSPDGIYAAAPWAAPTPNMYVAPPQFDGAMSTAAAYLPTHVARSVNSVPRETSTDLARSFTNLRVDSPNRTHAVSIKAPESKSAASLKSSLNPISPVYKPGVLSKAVEDVGTNNDGSLRQLQSAGTTNTSTGSDDTVSPAKRNAHLHSSSISSFETADFFPINPREYSTRQHTYPRSVIGADVKDQTTPDQSADHGSTPATPRDDTTLKSSAPNTDNCKGPAAPPGTPVYPNDAATEAPMPSKINGPALEQHHFDVPNRDAHNISPKSKREWVHVHEQTGDQGSSSPVKTHSCNNNIREKQDKPMDFSRKPREWMNGYESGLQCGTIGLDRNKVFIDGYCEGLKYLYDNAAGTVSSELSTGSPMKTHSRRPSPALASRTSSRVQQVEKAAVVSRPPFETSQQSLNTLKQAIIAPQNENMVLTPAVDGPHVTDAQFNLGAWAKHAPSSPSVGHSEALPGFPFPKRYPAGERQGLMSEGNNGFTRQDKAPYIIRGNEGGAPDVSNRISSVDFSLHRQFSATRIMTPSEWKAGSSVAHAAGLATGCFPPSQFDGAPQRIGSITSDNGASRITSGGRFREGSLDRITNPAMSPPPMSPTISPNGTPVKDGSKKKSNSPAKGHSPAKAKFEHMAEKMGIKVASSGKPETGHDGTFEPASPRGKRSVWREIWHKGGKEDGPGA